MDFSAKTGTDTLVVTKIELAPNLEPAEYDVIFDEQYWVVNRCGTSTFETDLTFTVSEDLTSSDESNPAQIALYTRSSTADTNWVYLTSASSINAANDEATFSGITEFSQFILGRWLQTLDAPQNVTIEIIGSDVQISWDEVSGANSYKIYASDDPYGTFTDVSSQGTFSSESWSTNITDSKKFYYVQASSETRRSSVTRLGLSNKKGEKVIIKKR